MTVTDFEDTAARTGRRRDRAGFDADEVVGELIPDGVDWERLVRTYPTPALVLAAAAGFWLGLRRGSALFAALTGFAAREMTRQVNSFLGEEVL